MMAPDVRARSTPDDLVEGLSTRIRQRGCMKIPRTPWSEITDRRVYANRRSFVTSLAAAGGASLVPRLASAQQPAPRGRMLSTVRSPLSAADRIYRMQCVEGGRW